jgi:hypothetical protein
MEKLYLYVKQHNVTGLKYFGMTAKKNPYTYLGSGKYWRRHLKSYGKDILTTNVWEFDNREACEKFALEFSQTNDIVESVEWANLRPENGRDGRVPGSPGLKKEKNPNWGKTKEQNSFYGKKHKLTTIELYKKQKACGNNPRAKKITTPLGNFTNIKEACSALGISRVLIKRLLDKGEDMYCWGWK